MLPLSYIPTFPSRLLSLFFDFSKTHGYPFQSMCCLHLGIHVKGKNYFLVYLSRPDWQSPQTRRLYSLTKLWSLLCNERNAATPWSLHDLSFPSSHVLWGTSRTAALALASLHSYTLQMQTIIQGFSCPWDSQWPKKVLVQSQGRIAVLCVFWPLD